MGSRIVGVHQVVLAGRRMARVRPSGTTRQPRLRAAANSGALGAGQQGGFDAGGRQSFDQPQHLPLAAAHLPAGIEVQDAHQLMFLALAYFRNV